MEYHPPFFSFFHPSFLLSLPPSPLSKPSQKNVGGARGVGGQKPSFWSQSLSLSLVLQPAARLWVTVPKCVAAHALIFVRDASWSC